MTKTGEVPHENLGRGRPKKHDPTITKGLSISEEAEYDAGNAIHYLSQYRNLGITSLIKAARFVRMAISRHNESEKLLGNTLEEYIKEDQEKS